MMRSNNLTEIEEIEIEDKEALSKWLTLEASAKDTWCSEAQAQLETVARTLIGEEEYPTTFKGKTLTTTQLLNDMCYAVYQLQNKTPIQTHSPTWDAPFTKEFNGETIRLIKQCIENEKAVMACPLSKIKFPEELQEQKLPSSNAQNFLLTQRMIKYETVRLNALKISHAIYVITNAGLENLILNARIEEIDRELKSPIPLSSSTKDLLLQLRTAKNNMVKLNKDRISYTVDDISNRQIDQALLLHISSSVFSPSLGSKRPRDEEVSNKSNKRQKR